MSHGASASLHRAVQCELAVTSLPQQGLRKCERTMKKRLSPQKWVHRGCYKLKRQADTIGGVQKGSTAPSVMTGR